MAINNNNQLEVLINQYINSLKELNKAVNVTVFDLFEFQKKISNSVKNIPENELESFTTVLREFTTSIQENNENTRKAVENQQRQQKEAQEENQKRLQKSIDDTVAEIDRLKEKIAESDNSVKRKYYEEKLEAEQTRLRQLNGEDITLITEDEEVKRLLENAARKVNEENTKRAKEFWNGIEDIINTVVLKPISDAARKVTSTYEQNAGNLAAALNESVRQVSNLQNNIADQLNSESLRSTISNIAVLSEASTLAKAGYTDETRLQSSAIALTIAKEIAPNLSLDTSTVRNLTNVFGTDFINKFSAIQAAVQETAGSTVGISETVTKLSNNVESILYNSDLQAEALQDVSDIQASLSYYQSQGRITGELSDEMINLVATLLDPSKALKSTSTTIRTALQYYDLGSGDVAGAWEAIQKARQQMYSGTMGNTAQDRISRSLLMSAFGETNTAFGTYNPKYLGGLELLQTEDLGTISAEQRQKLKSGAYATQQEREATFFENSGIARTLASAEKFLPLIYSALSLKIYNAIKSLPSGIALSLKGSSINAGDIVEGVDFSDLAQGKVDFGEFTRNYSGILNSSIFGLGSNTQLGRLTSGFTLGTALMGAGGAINIYNSAVSGDGFGFGGNKFESALNYGQAGAGIGALVGSFFPGLGNVIGAAVGGVVGAVGGLAIASAQQAEATRANTLALEKQTQATRDVWGQSVELMDVMETNRELMRGGGIVHTKSGDIAIDTASMAMGSFASGLDFVPFDNFPAVLHRGEAVVTAGAAQSLRNKNPNFWNTPMNDDFDVVGAINKQTESIVSAVNGEQKFQPLTSVGGPKQYKITNPSI